MKPHLIYSYLLRGFVALLTIFFVRFFISVTIKYLFTWSVNKTKMLQNKTPSCSFSVFLYLTPTSSPGLFPFPFPFSRPTHFLREKP